MKLCMRLIEHHLGTCEFVSENEFGLCQDEIVDKK